MNKVARRVSYKPIIVSEDYDLIDGRLAENRDAKGLSLGRAQWNDRGKVDISAKIWRHTGEKWSRQSEELPFHRVLDLAILICPTKLYFRERYNTKEEDYPKYPILDRIGLQGGAMNDACLHKDDELLSERLRTLSGLVKELDIV